MGELKHNNFFYKNYKLLISLALVFCLIVSVVYVSIAGFRISNNATGTLRFKNGIIANVTNLSLETSTLTASELSLFAAGYNDTVLEEGEYIKIDSNVFNNIQPGNSILVANPTIQPAVGTVNYCVRVKLQVRVGENLYSEENIRNANLVSLPKFNSAYWTKGADGYYYNTSYNNHNILDGYSDLNVNSYGDGAIPIFSSTSEECFIEVLDEFNYKYDFTGRVEILLVIEAVDSTQSYVEQEWDPIINTKNMAIEDMLIVPEATYTSMSNAVMTQYSSMIPSLVTQMNIENGALMVPFIMQNIPFNGNGVFDIPYNNLKNPTQANIDAYEALSEGGELPEGFSDYLEYAQSYLDNSSGYTLMGYLGNLTDIDLKKSYRVDNLSYLNYQARFFVYLATGVLYPYDIIENDSFVSLDININTVRILNNKIVSLKIEDGINLGSASLSVGYQFFASFLQGNDLDVENLDDSLKYKLENIILNNTMTEIPSFLFYGNDKIKDIILPKNIVGLGSMSFSYAQVENLIIEANDVNFSFGLYCLMSCQTIKKFIIPRGTIDIPGFIGIEDLEYIYIPSSVKTVEGENIYDYMFGQENRYRDGALLKLKRIDVAGYHESFKSVDGVLLSSDGSKILIFPRSYDDLTYQIPYGVTTIESYVFSNTSKVKTLILPNTVTTIKESAFYQSSVENLEFVNEDNLNNISGAFNGSNIHYTPSNVTNIYTNSFNKKTKMYFFNLF